jgi:HEAT repeat protein
MSVGSGLQKMGVNEAITGIKKLLFDEELEVRNAISWALCRIVLSRAGT